MTTYETIAQVINAILAERGAECPPLSPGTALADSGLDSLDVATLVVRLEDEFGVDPFREGTLEHYPHSIGELAALYPERRTPAE